MAQAAVRAQEAKPETQIAKLKSEIESKLDPPNVLALVVFGRNPPEVMEQRTTELVRVRPSLLVCCFTRGGYAPER